MSGADAHLCHLSRSIAAAVAAVPATAEAARELLRSTRALLHSAVDARCDELEGGIAAAEFSKIAALERELCTVDAALERWRAEQGTAAEAAASLGDAELAEQHAELTARFDAAESLRLWRDTSGCRGSRFPL